MLFLVVVVAGVVTLVPALTANVAAVAAGMIALGATS